MTKSITVLGCGDAFGSGGQLQSSYYVNIGHKNWLVDCGATASVGMRKYGKNAGLLDAIFITHFHADHYAGLPYILLEEAIVYKRERPLTIFGPKGIEERTLSLMNQMYPDSTRYLEMITLKFIEYTPSFGWYGMEIQTFEMEHSKASLPHGLRFKTKEGILAFTGDSEWTDNILPLSHNSSVFICECYGYNMEVPGHLCYKNLTKHPLQSDNVYLTHLGPEALENKNQMKYAICEDGMVITW